MNTERAFRLVWERDVPEIKSLARLYVHEATGAEILSLVNADANKTFGISFRTPPQDSTGVAHILEHSVLCGSRKYPSKEPFVELLKGSLQTFLNAMTFPDKTCYPVASQNLQDFYNLVDVYLDAVFHPRITRHIFEQEGWHYELAQTTDPLRIKGVVYNEMKGAYSSPDSLLTEHSQQSLFPDTTYGLDSGGHPESIPDLTYEAFKAFHHTYYHPSNARIFFSGDDPPEKRLALVQDYLDGYQRLTTASSVRPQDPFSSPRRVVKPFAASAGPDNRVMLTMNWLLKPVDRAEDVMAFQILEEILVGMPASPLRKALIDSGLGEDLAGVGLEEELLQMYFSTGLKGLAPGSEEQVENLILDTLQKLAGDGFDPRTVEAAVNSIEFRYRENNSGSYPQGLLFMLRALVTWLHDKDPLQLLAFEQPLTRIKKRLEEGERLFEKLVSTYLCDNSHRTTVILTPDPLLEERRRTREQERLEKIKSVMSIEELQDVVHNTRELEQMQSTPDKPEHLAAIPSLGVEDLDPEAQRIPTRDMHLDGLRIDCHGLDTKGIVYLDLGFDLFRLPHHLVGYVPMLGRSLLETGTSTMDYVGLSQWISRTTGGIDTQTVTSGMARSRESGGWFFLRGKAVQERVPDLLDICRSVLTDCRLDDRDRFLQLVLEEKSGLEQHLVPAGHQVVNSRLKARFSKADQAREQMGGVSQLLFLRDLAERVRHEWDTVRGELELLRDSLISPQGLVVNITAEGETPEQLEPQLRDCIGSLSSGPSPSAEWQMETYPVREGLSLSSQVNYVGTALDLFATGYELHGSALVISRYLRTSWLWEKLRVQGGAYGAFSLLDRFTGVLTLLSYRDPNLVRTLQVFDDTPGFLSKLDLSREELTKAIVGTIGDMDRYMLPDAKGFTACVRRLTGDEHDVRQQLREEILSTTPAHFKAFAEVLHQAATSRVVAVLGSRESIDTAAAQGCRFDAVQSVM
ncbi:MAG: insulinase family protein [Desulfohalobiaceae bacterium]